MDKKINILDIDIDDFTAKETMERFVEFMQTEPISVIEYVTADSLIRMEEVIGLKEEVSQLDVMIAGDATVMESAYAYDKRQLKELKEGTFLRMALRYICRHHKRVFLLVESEDEGQKLLRYLEEEHRGIEIAGMAKVAVKDRTDDMLVNAINGAEIDCVISALSSPLQEEVIIQNKNLLNAYVWLGIGNGILPLRRKLRVHEKISHFLVRRIFRKEIEKKKKSEIDVPHLAK